MTDSVKPAKSLEPYIRDGIVYYPHQLDGIRKMAKMKSLILGDDMGLGKTLQSLTVFGIDLKMGKAETCIIICPATVKANWANEIEKFTRIPYTILGEEKVNGKFRKITDSAERTFQLSGFFLDKGPRILITNYEQFTNEDYSRILLARKFDVAIMDEVHRMKDPEAKRTKAVMSVKSNRSFLLTGTPLLNRVQELWTLFNRIDPDKYPDPYRFANRYVVYGTGKFKKIVGTKNEAELRNRLGEVMIRRLKQHVLGTEKPTIVPVYVGLSDAQQELYTQAEDDFMLTDPVTGEFIDVDGDLAKFHRLVQICGTPRAVGPNFPDESLKLDKCIEMLDELAVENGEKVVVFTRLKPVLECLLGRAKKAFPNIPIYGISGDVPIPNRVPMIEEWGKVEGPAIIFAMIQVAGVGLNMTAASNVIFVDKLTVPGLNRQAIDRVDRIGQTKPVVVYELLVRGSVEHRIEEILADKGALFDSIVEGSMAVNNLIHMLKEKMKSDLQAVQ